MTDCIVLGAGMVGVATALALQARGRAVALVDRGPPGGETSHGNAGIIQAEAVEPYAFPRRPSQILAIALKRGNDVNWRLSTMRAWARPVFHYFLNSAPARHRRISAVYSRLIRQATADHAPLVEAAGAGSLIRKGGFREVWRSEAVLEAAAREALRVQAEYGVDVRIETGAELGAAESRLKRRLAGALHWREGWSCADPGGLVAAYAALFVERGGTIAVGDAASLARTETGWRVAGRDGALDAQDVVLALGPWTPPLLRRFGHDVPVLLKRGYHRHHAGAGPELPVLDAENGAVASPMRAGIRVLTGADLVGLDSPSTSWQLERAERAIGELFDLGEPVEARPWAGNRPCMPDMLPVVGPVPRHRGLWLNFGHGHQGFTLGPTTGRLLAGRMDGADESGLADSLELSRRL